MSIVYMINYINTLSFIFQSISPGIVETEFFTRLYKDKPEAADTVYSSIECLQANDIADAVTYILRMPPHVDVNDILIRPLGQAY